MTAIRWRHPTTEGDPASVAVHEALRVFYAFEMELLDEWRLGEWLDLTGPDFTYQIPVPQLTDGYEQLGYDPRALFMDETRDSIVENWVARLTPEHGPISWGDNPPVRVKRFASGLRVRGTDAAGEYLVRQNVRVFMVRQDYQKGEMVGERFDIVRVENDSFTIVSRFVTLSSIVLDMPRLRIIL